MNLCCVQCPNISFSLIRTYFIDAFLQFLRTFLHDRIKSCPLKHFKVKLRIKVSQRFDVPNIILKIEVVYANAKVVIRGEKFENIMAAFHMVDKSICPKP